ncbi:MAG: BamA/TamA family outer membrane protein [Flavobacteriales bacterium]
MQINSTPSFSTAFVWLALMVLLSSCSITRQLDDNETVLASNRIEVNGKTSKNEELLNYLKQQAKRSWFGLKLNKVVYNENKMRQSAKQLKLYFNNKSFFDNSVETDVKTKKKKTSVLYKITTRQPYLIDSIGFNDVSSEDIKHLISTQEFENQIKKGDFYDYWSLESWRDHLYTELKEKGYFSLEKKHFGFYADTLGLDNKVHLDFYVDSLATQHGMQAHEVFHFRKTRIQLFANAHEKQLPLDSLQVGQLTILYPKQAFPVNYEVIEDCLLFGQGDIYKLSAVNNTYFKLSNLGVFERIRINVEQVSNQEVDAYIELRKRKKLDFTQSLDGVHRSGNIGLSASLSYTDKNLFRGAEQLRIDLEGLAENQPDEAGKTLQFFNAYRVGAESSLRFPKLLTPVNMDHIFDPSKRVNTIFSVGINRIDRPGLGRLSIKGKYAYSWEEDFFRHQLSPLEINSVRIDDHSDLSGLSGMDLQQQYSNYLIPSSSYAFSYSNQNPNKFQNHSLVLGKMEFSGNVLNVIGETTNILNTDRNGNFQIGGNAFTQYTKLDLDFRHYVVFDRDHSVAFRFQSGVGIPYSNSQSLPFQKQYYMGGSNDLRAFSAYKVGPGSYPGTGEAAAFYTSDFKLESSLEYRFPIIKSLKGACFLDAGNIWELQENVDESGNLLKPGAQFKWDSFYQEIASGLGVGIRYDMDFLVLRFDIAHPMTDPNVSISNPDYDPESASSQALLSAPLAARWQLNNIRLRKTRLNIGVGFPF